MFRIAERHELSRVCSACHVAEFTRVAVHDRGLACRSDDDGPLLRRDPRGGFRRKEEMSRSRIDDFQNLRREN